MASNPAGRFKGLLFLGAGLVVGIFLAAMVLFASIGGGRNSAPPPATGKPIPDFSLLTLEGKEIRPGDLKGQAVVINFWATWCAPCRVEMPLFERSAMDLQGRVVFLAINDHEDAQLVRQFVESLGLNFPILLDPDGTITNRFYVQSYPTTFFIDSEGILRAQHIGQLDEVLLYNYLEAAGLTP